MLQFTKKSMPFQTEASILGTREPQDSAALSAQERAVPRLGDLNENHRPSILACWGWTLFFLIVILSSRVTLMTRALYRDESWVANSILSPRLRGMFYYDSWVQSTPPLFLLLVRGIVKLFGSSEPMLRVIPWLGGVLATTFFARTLLRLFPCSLAAMGTAFLVSNYWVIKYSQQAKQYGTDLLVSSIFLWLLADRLCGRATRRNVWLLAVAGGCGIFLSYTAAFWLVAGFLAVGLAPSAGNRSILGRFRQRSIDLITLSLAYGVGFIVCDWFFLRPNQSPNLTQFWMQQFIGAGGLATSLAGFFRNICDLILPQMFTPVRLFSYLAGSLILVAVARACILLRERNRRSMVVLLVTVVPLSTAIVASAMHKYPLLQKPRLIIWLLPICILLLVYALQPAWELATRRIAGRGIAIATVVCASFLGIFAVKMAQVAATDTQSTPRDDFRSGIIHIRDHSSPDVPIFVYALGAEELKYYSQKYNWHPAVYVANTNLGCCIPRASNISGDDLRRAGLERDVKSFFEGANSDVLWLLLQNGPHQNLILQRADTEAHSHNCQGGPLLNFSSTIIRKFNCRAADGPAE